MQDTILSVQKIPIRLTDERWAHITEEHCELAGLRLEVLETVVKPERVLAGEKVSFWRFGNYFLENIWWWYIGNWLTMGLLSPRS